MAVVADYFSQDSMRSDLSTDKPLWPLSVYGPAKHEPNIIFGLDESMEELRVRAASALKAGNVNEYMAYETGKIQAADQAFNNTRDNLAQAYQTAANQSPQLNKQSVFPPASTSAFGQTGLEASGSQPQSAFGQPAAAPQSAFASLQAKPASTTGGTAFGQTSFGQPQTQPQSVFGQPSSLIKPASGAFSAFANTGPSPFAAANQNVSSTGPSSGGGFSQFAGQPSTFGTGAGNTTSGSVFGAGSNAPTSGFGAPAPVFGQQQPLQPSAFGTVQSQPTSVFGQPAAQPQQQTPFGAQPSQPQPVFGAVQPQSAFGAPPTQPQSVFGGGGGGATASQPAAPSAFTPLSSPTNPLNAGTSSPFTSGPLGGPQPSATGFPPTSFSAFPSGPTSSPFTTSIPSAPAAFPGTTGSGSINPLVNPKTKPDFAAAMTKVKAKPGVTPYDSLLPPQYAALLPGSVVDAFKSQKFEFGKVPEWVPPVELR